MLFIKPGWLTHSTDKKACEVYSLHVSPDSERLATGGLDGNVRIWSTAAIFSTREQEEPPVPKQLCALSHHSGAVLAVRFSGNNRYLASGSDDKIVLVYERDLNAVARPALGTKDQHTDVWRTHRRLAGHDNDVQDLGWSADSSILVSVGLDSKVIVWSGSTFERLKRIDVHQSHVKGLTFDPASKYFATASDDRTVKIFRSASPASNATAHDQAGNFTVETTISAPFQDSPLTTYFRRCSWSPDGSHIAAPNAVNGPVSSVAIINRGNWDSEINLIGHEGPVEVCSFAPRMFSKEKILPGVPSNAVTVIACAGQDKALSIWNTSNPRPLLVIQDLATKAMSDLAWSPDGRSLFISSLDGSICCMIFVDGELGYVLGSEENEKILQKFGAGRKGATLPEGPDGVMLEELSKAGEKKEMENRMGALMMDGQNGGNDTGAPSIDAGPNVGPQWQVQGVAELPPAPPAEPVEKEPRPFKQKITITKDGKKRVAPLLVSTGGGHRSNLPNSQMLQAQQTSSASATNVDPKTVLDLSRPYDGLPKGGLPVLLIGNKRKPAEDAVDEDAAPAPTHGSKRLSVLHAPDDKGTGDIPEFIGPAVTSPAISTSHLRMAVPKVRTIVKRVIDATGYPSASVPSLPAGASIVPSVLAPTDTVFEARNSRDPTRLTLSRGSQNFWVDFLPKPVLLVTGNSNFWCAACEDGGLHIFTPVGRRMLNQLVIEAQPCFLECREWWLLCISAIGVAHVWNLKSMAAAHPPISLAPVLDIANTYPKVDGVFKRDAVQEASINSEGTIIVNLTNGDGYAYSRNLHTWQKLSEAWWVVGSHYWDASGAMRPAPSSTDGESGPASSAGIINHLERHTTTEVLVHGRGRFLNRIVKQVMNREGFEGFETAVSIAHLENRLAAAAMLQAKDDFRYYLLMYAKALGTEGMKGKVEELCRDFMGSMDEGDEESDSICGWSKRELLKEVVVVIGKHRDLHRVVLPYARLLGVMDLDVEL